MLDLEHKNQSLKNNNNCEQGMDVIEKMIGNLYFLHAFEILLSFACKSKKIHPC